MNPIEVINLRKSYGQFKALQDLNLKMNEGEILGLLGPNGAGKTTLISILTTLESPTSGEFRLFGESASHLSYRNLFGLVPQETVNHGFFTLEEVLEFTSGYHGLRGNKARESELLVRLGLDEHKRKKVSELSGGMKRRFAIAKALVHSPRLLLLDEPTAGVDIELRALLWEFVSELHRQGTAVLLTTHYIEEAEKLCDRVAVIDKGKILEVGPTSEMIRNLTERVVHMTLKEVPQNCQFPYLLHIQGNVLTFRLPSKMTLGELMRDLKVATDAITDIRIQEGKLEDAFVRILRKNGGPHAS